MSNRTLLKRLSEPVIKYRDLFLVIFGIIFVTLFFSFIHTVYIENKWPTNFLRVWLRWDTNHYLQIAEQWYGNTPSQENLIAFFPLYPLLIKLFQLIFRNWMLSAMVVANLAYVFAAFFLYKLILLDYDEKIALRAVFLFSIFPTSFILHGAYTESLFMALIISSFYFARKGKWWAACLIGMFATATRITGVVLLPALILEYLDQRRFKFSRDFFWLALVPLGTVSYLLINLAVFGSPFAFLVKQAGTWSKDISIPINGFLYHLKAMGWADPRGVLGVNLAEALYGLLGFGMAIYCTVKIRSSYAAFAFLSWLLFTATGYWLSIPRYTLTMFPIFIAFAQFGNNKGVKYVMIFFFITSYCMYLIRFITGFWAF